MKFWKRLFLFCTGYTYANLSRLFLRLFTGVMFLQLCVEQTLRFNSLAANFDGLLGMSPETSVTLLLIVELICAAFIILGFLTRIAVLPPLCMMLAAESVVVSSGEVSNLLFSFDPGYPVMFIGVFLYILLAGPGKISVDFIISAHMVDDAKGTDVLENA